MPSTATLLLPPRTRLAARPLPPALAGALGRADASAADDPGERAQLLRHFSLLPRGWPVAALTRSVDAGDAAQGHWLRADPAWVRPDINGARLFAIAEGMQLSRQDAEALLPDLRALFGDAGLPIDAPTPSRWYLRLPAGTTLPAFAAPEQALGSDLFETMLGSGAPQDGVTRRWRTLLNEAQVVLHNHPWNERRQAAGLAPVNSLWFWGGGALPDRVSTTATRVAGDDALLRGLAEQAGVPCVALERRFEAGDPGSGDARVLADLRDARDPEALCEAWLLPAIDAVRRGRLGELRLDFADGVGCRLRASHRWRFWRKPVSAMDRW